MVHIDHYPRNSLSDGDSVIIPPCRDTVLPPAQQLNPTTEGTAQAPDETSDGSCDIQESEDMNDFTLPSRQDALSPAAAKPHPSLRDTTQGVSTNSPPCLRKSIPDRDNVITSLAYDPASRGAIQVNPSVKPQNPRYEICSRWGVKDIVFPGHNYRGLTY